MKKQNEFQKRKRLKLEGRQNKAMQELGQAGGEAEGKGEVEDYGGRKEKIKAR